MRSFRVRRAPTCRPRGGTLNFHDDDTHVRVFTAAEVAGILRDAGLHVLHARRRRDPLMMLLTPARAVKAKLVHGFVPGGVLWDVFGFADQVLAERPLVSPPPSRRNTESRARRQR